MINEIPRRCRLDRCTPAERAIYDAMQAVEAMAADVRLTDAVILLGAARDSVADYVDNLWPHRRVVRMLPIDSEQSAEHLRASSLPGVADAAPVADRTVKEPK